MLSTRSFYIESKLPYEKDFYPNQVALIKIQDYTTSNAITIPLNSLQNDEKGKYVMVAVKEGDRLVARKKPIIIGMMYGDQVEVLSGIQAGDKIITEGYQGLYDEQPITTQGTVIQYLITIRIIFMSTLENIKGKIQGV